MVVDLDFDIMIAEECIEVIFIAWNGDHGVHSAKALGGLPALPDQGWASDKLIFVAVVRKLDPAILSAREDVVFIFARNTEGSVCHRDSELVSRSEGVDIVD